MIGVPEEIQEQTARAVDLIRTHFDSTLLAVHLYGSAVAGGLKPQSDVDLLVTVNEPPTESVRRTFMRDLLSISALPDAVSPWRPLEVTVVVLSAVVPWRYPPRRELQYGEWLRADIAAGNIAPAVVDPDLAILLTQVRQQGVALVGPPAAVVFPAIPHQDVLRAMAEALQLWQTPDDWQGDERNIVLTLARIWYTIETGRIAPKDVAAAWLSARLPTEHSAVLDDARAAYRGEPSEGTMAQEGRMAAFVHYVKGELTQLLQRAGL